MAMRILSLCLVLCGLWWWCVPVTMGADTAITVHQVEGIINPVVVEYITDSIRRAEEAKAVAVIFQLDTPGGLVDSTREIVKALLNTNVPTVVYVWPLLRARSPKNVGATRSGLRRRCVKASRLLRSRRASSVSST
jgi:membrane-bound ClpP family serine protease